MATERIKALPVEEAEGEVSELYARLVETRGSVPNLFGVLGRSARMLGPAIDLADFSGSNDSRVPARLKQLAYLATSRVNYCHYCLNRHAAAGRNAGLREEQVAAILDMAGDLLDKPVFDRQEKLVISLAEELTHGTKASPATVAAVRQVFNDDEFVELTFVVATANMFNRLADGLQVELEAEFGGTGR